MLASYLYFSWHMFMKLSSLLLRHAQRINTSFCLVINNPQILGICRKEIQCKATRSLFPSQYKRKRVVQLCDTQVIKGASHNVFLTEHPQRQEVFPILLLVNEVEVETKRYSKTSPLKFLLKKMADDFNLVTKKIMDLFIQTFRFQLMLQGSSRCVKLKE